MLTISSLFCEEDVTIVTAPTSDRTKTMEKSIVCAEPGRSVREGKLFVQTCDGPVTPLNPQTARSTEFFLDSAKCHPGKSHIYSSYDDDSVRLLIGVIKGEGYREKSKMRKNTYEFYDEVAKRAIREFDIECSGNGWRQKYSR